MHKLIFITSSLFGVSFLLPHLVSGQFSLPGLGGDSSGGSGYPRIKLAGPLGQLIGGQGISLNSGLGQVLSSIIGSAANQGSSSSSSSSTSPLSQLATAASTQYINAIRSLPITQQIFGSQQSQQPQVQASHHQPQYHGHPSGPQFNPGLPSQLSFLAADNSLYGAQPNFDNGHYTPQSFQHAFQADNYFGNQFGGFAQGGYGNGNNHGPSNSGHLGSASLYGGSGGGRGISSYNGHIPSGHHLDK